MSASQSEIEGKKEKKKREKVGQQWGFFFFSSHSGTFSLLCVHGWKLFAVIDKRIKRENGGSANRQRVN